MILTPQLGYLFNYVLIAAFGRFAFVLFGGGLRGFTAAIIPTVALFVGYRSWLWYMEASEKGTYVLSDQASHLLTTAIVTLIIVALLTLFDYFSKSRNLAVSIGNAIPKSFIRALPIVFFAFLIVYPVIVILGVDNLKMSQKWLDNYGYYILIYIILAWGLNIVVGFAGLLDLGYVAFYAVGAYTVALLGNHFGFSFWLCLPLAGILAALWGMMLGFPVLRLKGDYLAIVTLAFGEIIRIVLQNWETVTGGAQGLNVSAQITFFGISFKSGKGNFADIFGLAHSPAYLKIFLYYIVLAVVIAMAVFITRLRKMPIGRAWEALREDEIACRSLGINLVTTKLSAFASGAFFGGLAGVFFAQRQGSVDYTSFTFDESAMILAVVVLGGMGSLRGIAIAAIIMIGGAEALREIPSLQMIFGPGFEPVHYRMLWFGLAMVFIMIWRPRGFVSGREPSAYLKEKKNISGNFTSEGNG
nr:MULTISPECIES: high-affinity branched-chain amino acid ABC transporter permease LivM [unclassified Bartonella]